MILLIPTSPTTLTIEPFTPLRAHLGRTFPTDDDAYHALTTERNHGLPSYLTRVTFDYKKIHLHDPPILNCNAEIPLDQIGAHPCSTRHAAERILYDYRLTQTHRIVKKGTSYWLRARKTPPVDRQQRALEKAIAAGDIPLKELARCAIEWTDHLRSALPSYGSSYDGWRDHRTLEGHHGGWGSGTSKADAFINTCSRLVSIYAFCRKHHLLYPSSPAYADALSTLFPYLKNNTSEPTLCKLLKSEHLRMRRLTLKKRRQQESTNVEA